ncbi:MAG: glycerol-3-phosphate 1-O-acyltransferase PlsY [Lachnospiraceae bacterium]|nr:glycerol-3-phosphate 1-O-acyltransferase PlsY [Lachnospiraceae bacterium]
MKIIVCLIIGYLFGCVQAGYFFSIFVKHDDIRKHGSGNAGTANTIRTYGKKAGYIVYAIDAVKVIIAVLVIWFAVYRGDPDIRFLSMAGGLGAVLGHNFPFYLHFKGGKGIAATSGLMMTLGAPMIILCLLAFFVPYAVTKYVSVGSLVLTGLFPLWVALLYRGQTGMLIIAIIIAVMAWIQHRENIVRLLNGTERGFKKK